MRTYGWRSLPVLMLVMIAGCGRPSQAQSGAVVLVDTHGQCPLQGSWNGMEQCRSSRGGEFNALTPDFNLPHTSWGIAYSFRCRTPADFYVVVGAPTMDAFLPETRLLRHGLMRRGYYMETNRGWADHMAIPKIWRDPSNLEIDTGCAWHVIGVAGSARAVSKYVPKVPATF